MPSTKTTRTLAAAAIAAALALPAGAHAHGVTHKAPVPERALRAMERDLLGSAHAAEHAAQRAAERASARRWSRLSPGQKARVARRGVRAKASVEGLPLDQGGAWGATFDIKAFAINTVLLPTGKVLYWSFPYYPDEVPAGGFRPEQGVSYLWDPRKGQGDAAFEAVPPPVDPRTGLPAMIWCSGQSLLPDGRVLVAGGSLQQRPEPGGSWAGLQKAFVFDPWKEQWFEQASMHDGRWYPSQVLMADGATLILGGYDANLDDEERINPEAELFRPAGDRGGRFERVPSADRLVELYPHLFTMPGGDVLLAGPGVNDSALLDAGTRTWKELPDANLTRVGGTAVLRSRGVGAATQVTQIGGWEEGVPATATTETIDVAAPEEGWKFDAPLKVARRYHNTVLLPDGSMATVGGDDGSDDWTEAAVANRQVELYSEETGEWTLGPAEAERRGYHSTAVLLPDGRVLSAGDDSAGEESAGVPGGQPGKKKDTGQLYSPPYLFADGPRPVVAGAPASAAYGTSFGVTTPSEGDVASAVLMAPGATTHAVDMNQRRVELGISERTPGQGLRLEAPADPSLAPPGYYMLFLVAKSGKPSIAHWIRLGAAPAAEPQAPGDGSGAAPAAPAAKPTPAPGTAPAPPAAPAAPAPPAAPARPAAPGAPAAPSRRGVALTLRDRSARSVLRAGRVTVEARATRPARIGLRVRLASGRRSAALRETTVVLPAAGRRTVRVALTSAAKRLLRAGGRVRVTATTRGGDAPASAGRTLGR